MRKIARGNDCMDRNRFKLIHSELIQQVQCVENNLKIIYAAMRKGNFNNNLLNHLQGGNQATLLRYPVVPL